MAHLKVQSGNPNFEIIEQIGSGSFGHVYKALSLPHKTQVAIKRSPKFGKLVSREYQILKEVKQSPYCVQLLDIYYTSDYNMQLYQHLVFEFFPMNLGKFLRQTHKRRERLNHLEILSIMKSLLMALQFVHGKDIIHRDVKPDNILIDTGVYPYKVKLCDFGSAKPVSDRSTPYAVSRYYRAPELIFCNTRYGTKVDVWAAGCILLELTSCEPAFRGDTEGDQFIKQAAVLGPPSRGEVVRLVKDTVVPAHIAEKATTIGQRADLRGYFDHKAEMGADLASRMLAWDPDERWTAAQCLEHPFLT